jgi:hypothetical protein
MKWEDGKTTFGMDLRQICFEDEMWLELAQDHVLWQAWH